MIYVKVVVHGKYTVSDSIKSKLIEAWGEDYELYIFGMQNGLAEAMQNLPAQIEAIVRREGYYSKLATAVYVSVAHGGNTTLDIYIVPEWTDKLFCLTDDGAQFGRPDEKDYSLPIALDFNFSGEGDALEIGKMKMKVAAERLAADIAREFPKDINKRLVQIVNVIRRYVSGPKLSDFQKYD